MSLSCPKCSSDQTQRISILYHSGTNTISTSTVGAAIGSGHSAAVGVAATSGQAQSLLAQQLAPPQEQQSLGSCWVIILGFIGGVLGGAWSGQVLLFYILMGGSFLWAFALAKQAHNFNRKEFHRLYVEWGKQFMCLRCGHRFAEDAPLPTIAQQNATTSEPNHLDLRNTAPDSNSPETVSSAGFPTPRSPGWGV
jgi:hypothetical protein